MVSNIQIKLKWGLFIIHFRLHKMEWGIQKDPARELQRSQLNVEPRSLCSVFLGLLKCVCKSRFEEFKYLRSKFLYTTGPLRLSGSTVNRPYVACGECWEREREVGGSGGVEHTLWCQAGSASDSVSHRAAAKHKDLFPPLQKLSSLVQTTSTDTVYANAAVQRWKCLQQTLSFIAQY